ncbi:MAG: helix-turn-helix domain-containing protein [Planctomycetota bacterium]|jgi:predicted DNA-binding transcriptional regulator AlpA|nr:helix-turn-helix domain-containing protein [Planctomycetota bacterium]
MSEQVLLDAEELAGMLKIEKSFLYTLKSAGRLPPSIRLSRRAVRWRKDQILAWIAADCPAWEKMGK